MKGAHDSFVVSPLFIVHILFGLEFDSAVGLVHLRAVYLLLCSCLLNLFRLNRSFGSCSLPESSEEFKELLSFRIHLLRRGSYLSVKFFGLSFGEIASTNGKFELLFRGHGGSHSLVFSVAVGNIFAFRLFVGAC